MKFVTQTQMDVNLSVLGCLEQVWFKEGNNYAHCVPMLHEGGVVHLFGAKWKKWLLTLRLS